LERVVPPGVLLLGARLTQQVSSLKSVGLAVSEDTVPYSR